MKKYLPYIIALSMIILGILLFTKCEGEPQPNDDLVLSQKDAKINRLLLELSVKKTDTLKVIKKVYKTKHDTLLVHIYHEAPDTCRYYIAKLDSSCKRIDSVNMAIITEQEIQMIKYSEVVGLMQERNTMQEKRHTNDSTTIQSLDKKLKRTRKLAVIGVIGGFVCGLIVP